MIYCTERKIGIFLGPKTGSSSIIKMFKDIPVTFRKHTHLNYTLAVDAYEIPDFNTYKFFCFYRDPVSRFNSAYKYFKRHTYMSALHLFSTQDQMRKASKKVRQKKFDDLLFMNKTYPRQYDWLDEETKTILESITVEQVLGMIPTADVIPTIGKGDIALAYQKRWLDHNIDITYLNFGDFDNELRRLLTFFDATIDQIPHENENINLDTDQPLTTEQVNLVKAAYQVDYDFFASKGITFP
jgi:hypothetical protein